MTVPYDPAANVTGVEKPQPIRPDGQQPGECPEQKS
jgi:hypothetical protein